MKKEKKPIISKLKKFENEVFDEYMQLRSVQGSMKMPIYEHLGKKHKRSPVTIRCIVVRVARRRGINKNEL